MCRWPNTLWSANDKIERYSRFQFSYHLQHRNWTRRKREHFVRKVNTLKNYHSYSVLLVSFLRGMTWVIISFQHGWCFTKCRRGWMHQSGVWRVSVAVLNVALVEFTAMHDWGGSCIVREYICILLEPQLMII